MIARINGQVVARTIINPVQNQNYTSKPYQGLSVLQISNDKAELVKVKDYDLNRKHEKTFNADCYITGWAMDTQKGLKSGVSVTVCK